jgi:hypothetical protein
MLVKFECPLDPALLGIKISSWDLFGKLPGKKDASYRYPFWRTRLRTRLMLAVRIRRVVASENSLGSSSERIQERQTRQVSRSHVSRCDDFVGDISCHIGQSKEASSVKIGELFVIEPQ